MDSELRQPCGPDDPAVVLAVEDLVKSFYLHERDMHVPSTARVSLSVRSGTMTALTGPSGSGKSSLLKCVYRTYLTTSGAIWYRTADGRIVDLASASEGTVLELRKGEISFVTQFLHCLPRRTTLQVVAKPAMDIGMDADEAYDRAADLLGRVNLPERLWSVPPSTFSGGEKQRVNIVRSVITQPRLLLVDEPTASLDSVSAGLVVDLIAEQRSHGCGILAVLHDQELVATMADEEVSLSACPAPLHS